MDSDLRVEDVAAFPDPRGVLSRVFPFPIAGEVYVVTLEPGVSRGHHAHPATGEWFAAVEGDPVLVAQVDGTRRVVPLHGRRVRVPAGVPHAIFAPPEVRCVVVAAMERPHDPRDVVPFVLEAP